MKVYIPISIVLIILLSTGISGCIGGGDDEDSEGSGDSSSVNIDETGGYINPENLPISLNFPENAISGSTKISIKKIDDLPEKEGLIEDLGFDFSPDGTVFNEPVEIRMNYSDVVLPQGIEDYMLGIYKIDDGKYKLIQDCEVDPEKKIIKGKIITFSKYVAMGEKIGFIIHTNKNRIANDKMDGVLITCQLRIKKEGDTGEPTGEPLANTYVTIDMYALTMDGEKHQWIEPFRLTSDENGYIRYSAVGSRLVVSRYGLFEVTLSDYITATAVVDVGFDWPYFNHFNETLVGEEWERYNIVMDGQDRTFVGPNPISVETSPNRNEKFLGPFGAEKVVLTLDDIPPHSKIIVEFNIILIGPWQGGESAWMYVDNEPIHEGYIYGSWGKLSLQEDDYPGGYRDSDTINSLGYSTTKVVFTDGYGKEHTLDSGDLIRPVSAHVEGHFRSSIELVFTVDERGFGNESDIGQYWGIDDIYVRYVSGDD